MTAIRRVPVNGVDYAVPGPVADEIERLRRDAQRSKQALDALLSRDTAIRKLRPPERLRKKAHDLPDHSKYG